MTCGPVTSISLPLRPKRLTRPPICLPVCTMHRESRSGAASCLVSDVFCTGTRGPSRPHHPWQPHAQHLSVVSSTALTSTAHGSLTSGGLCPAASLALCMGVLKAETQALSRFLRHWSYVCLTDTVKEFFFRLPSYKTASYVHLSVSGLPLQFLPTSRSSYEPGPLAGLVILLTALSPPTLAYHTGYDFSFS